MMLGAGWLAEVSLAKLIVLLIGAVILVPVIMGTLFLIIVGSSAVIAACLSELPPWVARHASGDLMRWRELVRRPPARRGLAWGMVFFFTGLALAYGLAAGVLHDPYVIVVLVLLGVGAGLLISWLIQALTGRLQAREGGDIRPPDDREQAPEP